VSSAAAAVRLSERLRQSTLAWFDILTLYVGQKLGLYEALAAAGPSTPGALAALTGTHPRYVREWLEQQAVSGLLAVDDPGAEPGERRYRLPEGHARVLVDRDDPLWQGSRPHSLLPVARRMPALLDAFRTGSGLSPVDQDEDARVAQASLGRVAYLSSMGGWIASMPDVDARLRREPPARVADLGCGAGWSAIGLARAYPLARVDGFDLDPDSVTMAEDNAREAGVADRVCFDVRDAADAGLAGAYDLAVVFEALHDMPRPVEALRTLGRLAGPAGAVLVVDEKVEEHFTAPGGDLERFNYGWSVLSCLASGMTGVEPAGTGAVMRPATLRRYAEEAGFTAMEVLPVPHEGWTFYRLR
jgi:2-polyprenyl-3-methyl-5-hydroxy-6-metoxy-1,4-benzoquinol methylase